MQGEFTPKAVAGYETFLRGLTASTLDAAFAKKEFDFVAEVAADFPIRVLARMLDVPNPDDIYKLIDWGNRMIGNTDPEHADVLLDSAESDQYRLLPFRSPAALVALRQTGTCNFTLPELCGAAREASALYVLGDLFEYWMGDDDLDDPLNRDVAAGFSALSAAGIGAQLTA